MKKLLMSLLCLLSIAATSYAQAPSFGGASTPYVTTLDTVTNTATKTYTAKVVGYKNSLTFQLNMTKISGTTTGVYATLQASADAGINYKTLYVDTMGSASTIVQHAITGNPYTHYKWTVTGAGTQSSSYQAYLLMR